MNRIFCKRSIIFIASVSVLINIIVSLPYMESCYKKIRNKIFPLEYFDANTSDSTILKKVLYETINYSGVRMSMDEHKGLFYDLKSFFKTKRNITTINNYYTSYALVGASYYSMMNNDSVIMLKLKEKADNFILDRKLNYNIKRIDQIPIGILYLNLYKFYNDSLYLRIADSLFKEIIDMEQDSIIKYSQSSQCQFSDALGMYIPFLMEYFFLTGDSLAYNIADHNMKQYYKYGVNKETGIPSHGYNIQNKIHVGSSNWGRGIGWYLIAAAYCPQFKDENLDKSLESLEYTQFPGSSNSFDSSTAIMFEIYKQSKNKSRQLNIDFIKPHILENGFVDNCSGDTYYLNDYSHKFGESELCNGLLLILASKFKK